MPTLRDLQHDFAAAIFGGSAHDQPLLAHCLGPAGQAVQGLEAYRRSVLANLSAAVQSTYPILAAIVGPDFLAAAAHAYALERPSTSGDLNAFGHDFDNFLARYPAALSLPYLPDMARLEWQVLQVYTAADAAPQDLSLLAGTPPEAWGELCFRLDPAHALLASDWPVARIWEVNQPDYSGDFEVDFKQGQTVLIHRRVSGIVVEALPAGDAEFLRALGAGLTLEAALESAPCELELALQRHIGNGLLRQAISGGGEPGKNY